MAELTVADGLLHVNLSTIEKVGAFHGELAVPMAAIARVERLANARRAIRGVRLPGTGLPGVIALGTWRRRNSTDFVAVYRNRPGYMIELEGERFDRIVVSADALPALDQLV